MDGHDFDPIAAIDQVTATLRSWAPMLWTYFKALRDEGFSSEEAMELVVSAQDRLLTTDGGDDDG